MAEVTNGGCISQACVCKAFEIYDTVRRPNRTAVAMESHTAALECTGETEAGPDGLKVTGAAVAAGRPKSAVDSIDAAAIMKEAESLMEEANVS